MENEFLLSYIMQENECGGVKVCSYVYMYVLRFKRKRKRKEKKKEWKKSKNELTSVDGWRKGPKKLNMALSFVWFPLGCSKLIFAF